MGRFSGGNAWDFTRLLADRLMDAGYSLAPLNLGYGWLATKRGHSLGPFLPYTDFIFLHDLDSARVESGVALDALHEEHRAYGEGAMRVPRALRYRVPNTVTVGVSSREILADMREVATRNRHAVNSGEKNSVYLVGLKTGQVWTQGFEADPLRYGGSWVTTVNPSNRVAAELGGILTELAGETPKPSSR
jgi:hypothetical protein